jgi:hypothetical protein
MQPVTQPKAMGHSRWTAVLAAAGALFALAACDLPFGLGLPSTRALENGAVGSLSAADSFEIAGSFSDASGRWTIDLQLVRPDTEHLIATSPDSKLEAIVIGKTAYFRGRQFLAEHIGGAQASQDLVRVAGDMWWKGPRSTFPQLAEFTDGPSLKSAFLGPIATRRTDHVSVDGVPAVEMSSPRADVFIAALAPYRLLRVHLAKGATIDGIADADFRFSHFNQDFQIAAPPEVIDFSNLSSLPPVYTVVFVDTSQCTSPCKLSALLKNAGGLKGAQGRSSVTFTVTDPATGKVAGTCKAPVGTDVGYNSTTTVSCTMGDLNTQQLNAAKVTATVDGPAG